MHSLPLHAPDNKAHHLTQTTYTSPHATLVLLHIFISQSVLGLCKIEFITIPVDSFLKHAPSGVVKLVVFGIKE